MGFSYSGKLFGGTGSGGVSVSGGVNTQVAYFTGASSLSSDSGLTYDAATDTLTTGSVNTTFGMQIFSATGTVTFYNGIGTPDVGLARSSAGVLKVTDGGTGAGGLVTDRVTPSDVFVGARVVLAGFEAASTGTAWRSLGVGFGNNADAAFLANAYLFSSTGSIAADGFLTAPAAATLQLGAANSATPVAQTLQAQGGSGTNIAGANLTIQSGAGTGSATGSLLEFKTPTEGGSGSTAQTMTTRLSIGSSIINIGAGNLLRVDQANTAVDMGATVRPQSNDARDLGDSGTLLLWRSVGVTRATLGSKSKTLTDATPTAFATIPMADGVATGGKLIYRCVVTSGTSRQVVSGSINYAAVRDGASYVVDYDEVQQSTAVTTGTLTGSVTAAGASNLLTFSANFDTDLGTPTITFWYRFDSTDVLAITPL